MEEKLREYFDGMVVYKDLQKTSFFKALSLPAFLRDWLLQRFQDEEGNYDTEEISEFVNTYMPKQEEWKSIKNRIIYGGEKVKLLTKICADINIKTGEVSFSLPNYGLDAKESIIESDVWSRYGDALTRSQEIWGVVELGYREPDEEARPKISGKIKLTGFTDFCPYELDLDFYKEARREFTLDEWIDVVLGAIDYNAAGYKNEEEKLAMLMRILPFVEKNLNIIELAPKGTGKSYFFGSVSKHGTLVDGGRITRARMFYDVGSKKPGYICGNDYVAIDEVKKVKFGDVSEMQSVMQAYMESGKFNVNGHEGMSTAGVVMLGNIELDRMNEELSMLDELPELFRESALVDRIHGFIKGWDIPKMSDALKASGWALNSEYFCSVLHLLRDDISYRSIVDKLVEVSGNAYVRHTEAVKRLATAYLKLLFPQVRVVEDVDLRDFNKYCLQPAKKMREIIWNQLAILDKEYKEEGKRMPLFSLRNV